VRAYKSDLQQFCATLPTDEREEPLSPAAIRDTLTRMAKNPRLAPATVKRRIAAVRAFVQATDRDLARDTFVDWCLPIQTPRRLPRALSSGDMSSLLDTLNGQPRRAAATTRLCLMVLAATGLRVSELCSLTLEQVQMRTGEIRVRGKGARERVVIVVNDTVRSVIETHIRTLPNPADPSAPLLLNQRLAPLTPQCLRLRLHALARQARLSRAVTPHMFRHTAATLLLEAGVDLRFVQRLLGHASIATTQIYTHVTDVALRHALKSADVMHAFI